MYEIGRENNANFKNEVKALGLNGRVNVKTEVSLVFVLN